MISYQFVWLCSKSKANVFCWRVDKYDKLDRLTRQIKLLLLQQLLSALAFTRIHLLKEIPQQKRWTAVVDSLSLTDLYDCIRTCFGCLKVEEC